MLINQYDNVSEDSDYLTQKDQTKLILGQGEGKRISHPILVFIDAIVQPERKTPYRAQQIFFVMTSLFYFCVLVCVMITFNFRALRKFIQRSPLIYTAAWSVLLPCMIAISCYPSVMRKQPYNYLIFCGTFYSQLYIILYLCVWFRRYQSQLYILQLLIFHVVVYYKFQSVMQSYYTVLALPKQEDLDPKLSSPVKLIDDNSFDDTEWHQFLEINPDLKLSIEEIKSQEKKEDEMLVDEIEPEEQKVEVVEIISEEIIKDEKLEVIVIQPEEKLTVVLQDALEVESPPKVAVNESEESASSDSEYDKKDFQIELPVPVEEKKIEEKKEEVDELLQDGDDGLIIEEEKYPSTVSSIIFDLEKEIISQPLNIPEHQLSLKNNLLFLIGTSLLIPTIAMLPLNDGINLLKMIPLVLLLFVYGCIVFLHIRYYSIVDRTYVLNYNWVNCYYLTLTYWLVDLVCPIVLIRANQDYSQQMEKEKRHRSSVQ